MTQFSFLSAALPASRSASPDYGGGLADGRGNLALEYLRLADRLRPRWLLWENVPGVLSSNKGRDFAAFLGGVAQLGYGFAYRVLDAQYFGLAQRRKRVFVVGYLGDWRRAAAVLFEPASLRRDSAPRREPREGASDRTAYGIASDCLDRSGEGAGGTAGERPGLGISVEVSPTVPAKRPPAVAFGGNNTAGPIDIAPALNACGTASGRQDFESEAFVTSTLVSNGDAHSGFRDEHGLVPVSVALRGHDGGATAEVGDDKAFTLRASTGDGDKPHVLTSAVRRLTPRECERLQGFPDGYTRIPVKLVRMRRATSHFRNYPDLYDRVAEGWMRHAADGPRYKALGNSMAVPVMRWIGARIAAEDARA